MGVRGQLRTSVACMRRRKKTVEVQRRLDPTEVPEKTNAATLDLDLPLTTWVAEQVLIYHLHQ
jgi:hypothetical protein